MRSRGSRWSRSRIFPARLGYPALLLFGAVRGGALSAQQITLPPKSGAVKFAVIGDVGTGEPPEYDVAKQVIRYHGRFPFTFVLMLGDNIYGSERPQDFETKFSTPYKPLLD